MEKQNTIKQRLKNRFTKMPINHSLVDELIAERREAAKEEATDSKSYFSRGI